MDLRWCGHKRTVSDGISKLNRHRAIKLIQIDQGGWQTGLTRISRTALECQFALFLNRICRFAPTGYPALSARVTSAWLYQSLILPDSGIIKSNWPNFKALNLQICPHTHTNFLLIFCTSFLLIKAFHIFSLSLSQSSFTSYIFSRPHRKAGIHFSSLSPSLMWPSSW